ncbi:MAG: PAC2 family protein, partial [Candidatus Thermoplasmatota archaeon]|nr:PAC2 family protein [Candidatus Thermoplasmatota archaeon]
FEFGTIGGFTGVMLNEGKLRSISVLGLLAEVEEDIPDARAASKIIEAIDKLLLEIDLDPKPLLEEAASLEKELQKVNEQVPVEANNSIPRYIG